MDQNEFKERSKRLKEVNNVIASLDPAIRESAYAALEEYVTGKATVERKRPPSGAGEGGGQNDTSNLDRGEFILAHHKIDDQPADNAILLAAWHYKEYGSAPFSNKEIKDLADDAGLTIPARLDMTFKSAQQEGKNTFTSPARGMMKPTVHGEKRLKDTFNIAKGNKKKPAEGDS